MRDASVFSAGMALALGLGASALAQEGAPQSAPPDSATPPDHTILTNAKPGGSPKKPEAAATRSTDTLLRRVEAPSVEEIRGAIRADAARDPKLAEFYRDLLNPEQSFRIGDDGQGNRAIFYLTPDRRPVILRPDDE